MIIKTPINELKFVLEYLNKTHNPDAVAETFLEYFKNHLPAFEYKEKYIIVDAFNAGTEIPLFIYFDGQNYFKEKFEVNE